MEFLGGARILAIGAAAAVAPDLIVSLFNVEGGAL